MSGKIDRLDEIKFEEWIVKNYPDLFIEWENEYSEFMDLDCHIYASYHIIFREWQYYKEYIILGRMGGVNS